MNYKNDELRMKEEIKVKRKEGKEKKNLELLLLLSRSNRI